MPAQLSLEDFAAAPDHAQGEDDGAARIAALRQAGYDEGLAAGMEAAAQAHADAQDRLRAGLVEAIRDQALTHQEMQAAILRGIAPLAATVIRRLAPRLAAAGLPDLVTREVAAALATRPEPAPSIRCAEEAVAPLRGALADWGARVTFAPDPALTPLEAEVHWDDGFDAIDLGALVARIDAAFDKLLSAPGEPSTGADARPAREQRHAG